MSNVNDLDYRIKFHEMVANDGPEVGETSSQVVYECWAGIRELRISDYEQAKSNNTLEDISFFIRDPRGDFKPTNKHTVSIIDSLYEGKLYKVKAVLPDVKRKQFIDFVTELKG